jgi:predicted PurR-regulated permease PerM
MKSTATGGLRALATRAAVVGSVVLAVAGTATLFALAAQVLLLIFAGLLLAVLLSTSSDALVRVSGMPRAAALPLVVLSVTAVLVGSGFALWPSISDETDQLAKQLPPAIEELLRWFEQREWGRWLLGRSGGNRMVLGSSLVYQTTGVLISFTSAVAGLLVIVFVGMYVAAQPRLYHRGLRRLMPVDGRARLDTVLLEVTSVLRWWLVGTLMSMTLVGVLTTVGLWWLGVPLALTFGLLAAALTFIPNFGPVLSVVPPAILALADDPRRALFVVGLYLAVQIVESYGVTPLIQRRTIAMPPALTIASQIVLGSVLGVIGIAVATPLTAAAMTIIRMLYVEDLLERGVSMVTSPESPPNESRGQ